MTLTDTGPLVSLLDRRQEAHLRCREVLSTAALPLLTTWPCFTEAMYFAYREGGHPFQKALWRFLSSGVLGIYVPEQAVSEEDRVEAFLDRMEALMSQYHDLPMDLADASLVATAERLGTRRIFTLDKDFFIYRTSDGGAFEVVPD